MRRRVNLLLFDLIVPKAERDLKLVDKLRGEWPGILQWQIEGCLAWQKQGLNPPESVIAATDAYFESEDGMALWIEERCELVKGFWQPSEALWRSWRDWAEKSGVRYGSRTEFKASMEKRGFRHERNKRGQFHVGLRMRQYSGGPDADGGFLDRA